MTYRIMHTCAAYTSKTNDYKSLKEKLLTVASLVHDLRKEKKETIFKEDGIYEREIACGLQVFEAIYQDSRLELSRDDRLLIMQIIDQSVELDADEDVSIIAALGPFPSEEDHFALRCISQYPYLIRRSISACLNDSKSIHESFAEAFPSLCFSEEFPECLDTFPNGVINFRSSLSACLGYLNDDLRHCIGTLDIKAGLKLFSSRTSFETTMEGNIDRHNALTFVFQIKNAEGEIVQSHRVRCEPHMKIDYSDIPGDREFRFCRIYFTPHSHPAFASKIMVGHAGAHR